MLDWMMDDLLFLKLEGVGVTKRLGLCDVEFEKKFVEEDAEESKAGGSGRPS